MGYKLLITPYQDKIISALYDGKRLLQVSADEQRQQEICIGGIYVGKVKNIVANINAAFVELKPGLMSYLALDGGVAPVTANTHADGKIHAGDEIVVQVEREPIKSKLASVTCALNLTGKYAVLVHGKRQVGVSSKITEPKKRGWLRELFEKYVDKDLKEDGKGNVDAQEPDGGCAEKSSGCAGGNYGFIVRTNAAQASEEEILAEISALKARYEKLLLHGVHRARFSVLEEPLPAFLCSLRDLYSEGLDEILTDEKTLYEQMKTYLEECQPEDAEKLHFYTDELPMKVLYSLEHRIKEALQKKVWLKSGASLVIEPTEALTVIDVNTGKAVKERGRGEEHFLRINLEAAKEIAGQIRLRNLSGIILVDFIDMEKKESDETLLQALKEFLAADPVKTVFVDMTPLHLVEITRKKVRRPLHEEGFKIE